MCFTVWCPYRSFILQYDALTAVSFYSTIPLPQLSFTVYCYSNFTIIYFTLFIILYLYFEYFQRIFNVPKPQQIPQMWGGPAPSSSTSWGARQGRCWRGPWGPHHCNLAPQLHHWTPRQTSSRHCPADGRSSGPQTGGCVGIGGWR